MTPSNRTPAARGFDGGSFRIAYEWKEMLTYWEGADGFAFDCAWGVDPGLVFVPPADRWDEVVPSWMVGRRETILQRLREFSGHAVKDDDKHWSRVESDSRIRGD
jgi:hypothetical protein